MNQYYEFVAPIHLSPTPNKNTHWKTDRLKWTSSTSELSESSISSHTILQQMWHNATHLVQDKAPHPAHHVGPEPAPLEPVCLQHDAPQQMPCVRVSLAHIRHNDDHCGTSDTDDRFKHILFMTEHDKGLGRAKKLCLALSKDRWSRLWRLYPLGSVTEMEKVLVTFCFRAAVIFYDSFIRKNQWQFWSIQCF